MRDLIKFELYKIYSKKSVKVVSLLVILFSLFYVFAEVIQFKSKGAEGIDYTYQVMKEHEGKVITPDGQIKADEILSDIYDKEHKGETITQKELVYKQQLLDITGPLEPAYIINHKGYTILEIEEEMKELEEKDMVNTYDYKSLSYIYDKVKNVEEPIYSFDYGWIKTTSFASMGQLICILVIVGLGSIFSEEYQSDFAQVMLSTKKGKQKVVLSKIITGIIYTSIAFIVVNGIHFISVIMYDFKGWDKPVELFKYYQGTPFDISILEFYILGLGISFIGAILLSFIVMLVSLLSRSNLITFLIGLGMYYVPMLIFGYIPNKTIASIVNEINISALLKVDWMFTNPSIYNIFGNPVLYPYLLVSLALILIPIVTYLINYFGKRQAI